MKKWIYKPENLFLVIGLVFGILYLIITPPFQVADENRHFYRAFQVAEGGWLPVTHEGQVGGWLPESVVQAGSLTDYMRWDPTQKISRPDILKQFRIILNPENRIFLSFRSAVYTPVAYLPAAAVIRLGIWCKLSPIFLMYLGRFTNLIAWLVLIWTAIHIIPFFRWVFVVAALTPMSLYQAASLSADSMTNALAFLTIAYFLYWIYGSESRMKPRHVGLFFLLTILLSATKNVFFPVSFLILLIPIRKFVNKKTYYFVSLSLVGANLVTCLIWYQIVKEMPIGWKPDVYPEQQITFILTHPFAYVRILFTDLFRHIEYEMKTFIGRFGWMDTPLPKWHYHLWGLFLLVVILTDGCWKITVPFIHKMVYLLIFGAISMLIVTLLYIYWNPVGAEKMLFVQGRYFIPIAPLFLLCFYNKRLCYRPYATPLVISLMTVLSLANALAVFFHRFYIP